MFIMLLCIIFFLSTLYGAYHVKTIQVMSRLVLNKWYTLLIMQSSFILFIPSFRHSGHFLRLFIIFFYYMYGTQPVFHVHDSLDVLEDSYIIYIICTFALCIGNFQTSPFYTFYRRSTVLNVFHPRSTSKLILIIIFIHSFLLCMQKSLQKNVSKIWSPRRSLNIKINLN